MKGSLIAIILLAVSMKAESSGIDNLGLEVQARASHRGRERHDHDVRPDFRQPCICARDTCPSFLNKKAMCECKGAAAQACYLKSERGCPAPSRRACY
ncbi:hypothetical protein QBC37DRAFT_432128 [Rhypophila decipiens]|uniref:Uncharacterized protein n=1 Tax=Rhypophila decipiens TaxID=261697 RepID=A0AAN6XX65_9PEZI|nr:hypothetical protein QBC37DRAFT_432128 [Rhypophila decipiens]